MTLPYIPPGVTISEVTSPAFNPTQVEPTSIAIVGPARGYEEHVERVALVDNHPVTLAVNYADLTTISVVDALDVTADPFVATANGINNDYDVDTSDYLTTGVVRIARSMQTTIEDDETVVVYFENSASPAQGDSFTTTLALPLTTAKKPSGVTSDTEAASIAVLSEGAAPAGDFTVSGEGTTGAAIVWNNVAAVLHKFQTVYLDYVVGDDTFTDVAVQLNNLTTVPLDDNADNVVVKTAPGADTGVEAVLYQKGTTTDLDYVITGSGATTSIARSAGTTTIGGTADKLVVRVSYRATPPEYWLPTRCFSQADVENKFGAAFDSGGNVLSPVSLAAGLSFQNGASSLVIQALFAGGTPNTQPTGVLSDWQDSLESLRNVEDINVVVPLINTGGLSTNDGQNITILSAVQGHLYWLLANLQRHCIAIMGEDSTDGISATADVLRDHASTLSAGNPTDSTVLVSPSAYSMVNPVTGQQMVVGGQYAAACVAGMLGRVAIQIPLTRKRVNGLTGLREIKTIPDKNADAQAGLLVIETKRSIMQVRDAITTAQDNVSNRELSVVRGKHWIVEQIRQSLEDQVIGQILIDSTAPFKIQLLISTILQRMIDTDVIVSYGGLQIRRHPTDPTAMQVRFSYLPAYPLKRIELTFSIDTSQNTVSLLSSITPTVQTAF